MLRIEDTAGVRTLTLDRPDRLNALNGPLLAELHRAVSECARDPGVRCVVLTGAGRGFCAGADLAGGGERDALAQRWADDPIWWEPEQVAARMMADSQIPVLLHRMSKPTVAAIRGPAAGSGLLLALACDLRIASQTAVFKTAFATAGRCGDPGVSFFLSNLVGAARAREMFLLDEKVSAERALDIGLISKLVSDDALEAETATLAARLASGPGLAYAGIKRNLNAAMTAALEETIVQEGPVNVRASLSHDGKEAGRAFMEKRSPQFRGY